MITYLFVAMFQLELLINTCMLHTITGLALATFIAPVELLNASYEKGASLKVAIGA